MAFNYVCVILFFIQVSQPSGMETVNAAIKELMDTVPQSEWKTASVSVAPSTVQVRIFFL